jgi:hypothetical protein
MATTTINVNATLAGLSDVFFHKETTPSAAVTGTLTETEIYSLEIPANSFSAGDKFVLDNIIVDKTGTAGAVTIRIKLSTSPTLPSVGTDLIGAPILALASQSVIMNRAYNIQGGNITGFPFAGGQTAPSIANPNTVDSKSFDTTVTNYLYISVILGNIADSVTVHGYTLKNF